MRAQTSDAILLLDGHGIVLDAAPPTPGLLGDVVGRAWSSLPMWLDGGTRAQALFDTVVATPGSSLDDDLPIRLGADGGWVTARLVNLLEDEEAAVIVVLRDATEAHETAEGLIHQAFHDPLTGLANRALFHDRLDHALRRAARTHTPPAVLYVDLDRFKAVNDDWGHAAGDEVLRQVAERLSASVRPQDTAARLGGDEFAVLLEARVDPEREASVVASRILQALREPIAVGHRQARMSASIGVSVARLPAGSADVVRRADAAMYAAKASGRDRWSTGTVAGPAAAGEVAEAAELVEALAADDVHLLHQPVFDLTTGRVVGAEALIRWNHPGIGSVDPRTILELARSAGALDDLTRWSLTAAASQAAGWRRRGGPAYVSVNLAPDQLDDDLPSKIERALSRAALDPGDLVIEVSGASTAVVDLLRGVQRLGVRVALDDIGSPATGVPDLIGALPANLLKIPPSVVAEIAATDSLPEGLVRAGRLGRALAIDVVAVGVARPGQRDRLVGHCSHVQGHLHGTPVPPGSIDSLLGRQPIPSRLG